MAKLSILIQSRRKYFANIIQEESMSLSCCCHDDCWHMFHSSRNSDRISFSNTQLAYFIVSPCKSSTIGCHCNYMCPPTWELFDLQLDPIYELTSDFLPFLIEMTVGLSLSFLRDANFFLTVSGMPSIWSMSSSESAAVPSWPYLLLPKVMIFPSLMRRAELEFPHYRLRSKALPMPEGSPSVDQNHLHQKVLEQRSHRTKIYLLRYAVCDWGTTRHSGSSLARLRSIRCLPSLTSHLCGYRKRRVLLCR